MRRIQQHDYTRQPSGADRDRWVLGGSLIINGAFVVGTFPTWSTVRPMLGAPFAQHNYFPVELRPTVVAGEQVRKVKVLEIDGTIQDESDSCDQVLLPSILSVSEGVPSSSSKSWASSVVGAITEYTFYPVLGSPPGSTQGTVFNTTSTFSSATCPCGGGYVSGLTIGIYVTTWDASNAIWRIRNLQAASEVIKDFEFLSLDSYHLPNALLSIPYSGRSWRLRLPRSVVIGSGQALCVSVGYDTVNSNLLNGAELAFRAAFRTLIRSVV